MGPGSSRPAGLIRFGELQAKRQQPGGDVVDDIPHFGVTRLERLAPFQRPGQDFRLAGIGNMPAVEIVIGGARRRVGLIGLLDVIGGPSPP